jgi:hypothetical protein
VPRHETGGARIVGLAGGGVRPPYEISRCPAPPPLRQSPQRRRRRGGRETTAPPLAGADASARARARAPHVPHRHHEAVAFAHVQRFGGYGASHMIYARPAGDGQAMTTAATTTTKMTTPPLRARSRSR